MKKLIFILIAIIGCFSCSVEQKFKKLESCNLSQVKEGFKLTAIDSLVMGIFNNEFCASYPHPKYPNLKYVFVSNFVKVTQYDHISSSGNISTQDYNFGIWNDKLEVIFRDSILETKCTCDQNQMTVISLPDDKLHYIRGRLKKGFGSQMHQKNLKKAYAILESHHSVTNFKPPINISKIQTNNSLDSVVVSVHSTYSYEEYFAVKAQNQLKKIKTLGKIIE